MKDTTETVNFIEKVFKFWKIVSDKEIYIDIKRNNTLKKVIIRFKWWTSDISNFGKMTKWMGGKQGKRMKSLTRYISLAIEQIWNGLTFICRYLLSSEFNFVMFCEITTNYLESEYGKLKWSSGGTYFKTVIENNKCYRKKFYMEKTKLLLELNVDFNEYNFELGYNCSKWGYLLDEMACQIFANLKDLKTKIYKDIKMSLLYTSRLCYKKRLSHRKESIL